MGKILYLLTILGAGIAIPFPWVGVVNGYFSILLGPHVLWWWNFEGSRHFLIISTCTFIGLIFYGLNNRIEINRLFNKFNFYLFIWLFFILISFFFGPYVAGGPGERYFDPKYIVEIAVKSFLFYFASTLCIDSEKKFKYLVYVIIFSCLFYIYWINERYLSGYYGRLGGPKGSNIDQYGDENNFAMFFVIALPFIYYLSLSLKNKFLKYLIWLIVPLGWHAVFLTGSRGGLLGLASGVVTLILRSSRKRYGILVALAMVVAFVWQGGPVMQERAQTITIKEGQADESIEGRLASWVAATKMMLKYPVTGVGVASFGMAYPDFSEADPREAHNTFFQIGAESGVFAVVAYLLYLFSIMKELWVNNRLRTGYVTVQHDFSNIMSDAVLSAWVGFIVSAMFLSLQLFEQFFYLALLTNYVIYQNKQVVRPVP